MRHATRDIKNVLVTLLYLPGTALHRWESIRGKAITHTPLGQNELRYILRLYHFEIASTP